MNLLIIEENKKISEVLKVSLEPRLENSNIHILNDPKRTTFYLSDNRPDIILLDLDIQNDATKGLTLLRSIKQDFYSKNVPMVILTNNKDPKFFKTSLSYGVSDFIIKPPKIEDLVKRIKTNYEKSIQTPLKKQRALHTTTIAEKKKAPITPVQKMTHEQKLLEASKILSKMLKNEELKLPVLPQIAMEIQKQLKDPNVNLKKISELVKQDLSISAKVLKIANSSYYCSVEKITELHNAIVRIGMKEIKTIIQMLSGNALFQVSNKKFTSFMQQLWEHSLCTAYANQFIGKKINSTNLDNLFLMGLLHDIGKVFLIYLMATAIEKKKSLIEIFNDKVVTIILHNMHNQLGEFMIKKWNISEDFIPIVKNHDLPCDQACDSNELTITYLSNMLTRKLNYSMEPFNNQTDIEFALEKLNIDKNELESMEIDLTEEINKIKESFFSI